MARLFTCGIDGNQFGNNSLEGLVLDGTNTPSYVTTSPHTGTYCLECYATATYASYSGRQPSGSFARGYARAAMYIIALEDQNAPPTNCMYAEHGGTRVFYGVDSSGHMRLYSENTLRATGTYTLAISTWYVLQFQVYRAGASSVIEGKLWDSTGTTLLETLTDTTNLTTSNLLYFGIRGGAWNNANKGCRWDDFAVNDATGTQENSYPDAAGRIVICLATAHSSIGIWTTGLSGVTNLQNAVKNLPPTGNTTESATTNIIAAFDASVDNCDLKFQTYFAMGIGANDAILLAQPIARYGNHSTDAGMLFATQIVSNPVGSLSTPVAVGTSAHSTEIGSWLTHYGVISYAPAVAKDITPVLRVQVDFSGAAAGSICVDFVGLIVEYKALPILGTLNKVIRPRPFMPGIAR